MIIVTEIFSFGHDAVTEMMFGNLIVVELASVLAGPSVGQFFAELGAEVIKIENPGTDGDVTRSWLFRGEKRKGTISSYFSSVNWGKKSVILDLKDEDSLQALHRLIAKADVLIASYKPGDSQKLKVDYETLATLNPRLIYGHITGFGLDDQRVGYDAVIQAESGFMSINGEREGGPLKMPVALIDVLAAHHLKQGILIALINRLSSGKGDYVPVSLIDAAVSSLANQGANWLVGEKVPTRSGNEHPNIAPYGDVFKTADEKQIILAVGNDRQFELLNKVLSTTLHQASEFKHNTSRVTNRQKLNRELSAIISQRRGGELINELNQMGVPVGVVRKINEVFTDAPDHWLVKNGGSLGVKTFVAKPRGQSTETILSPPPELGAHTRDFMSVYGSNTENAKK